MRQNDADPTGYRPFGIIYISNGRIFKRFPHNEELSISTIKLTGTNS